VILLGFLCHQKKHTQHNTTQHNTTQHNKNPQKKQMILFFQLCWIVIRYLSIANRSFPEVERYFTPIITHTHTFSERKEPSGTLWISSPKAEKAEDNARHMILFLSGLMDCEFTQYIKKTIHDLIQQDPLFLEKNTVLVYENPHESSIEVAEKIAQSLIAYHNHNHNKNQHIQRITIVGFSSGGVLASHVMQYLHHPAIPVTCVKHIITYDTPLSVPHVMRHFHKNWIFRLDILYYYFIVLYMYRHHWRHAAIKQVIDKYALDPWFQKFYLYRGVEHCIAMMSEIHGITSAAEFERMTSFAYDQSPNTQITHIYSERDPVLDLSFNDRYRQEHLTSPRLEEERQSVTSHRPRGERQPLEKQRPRIPVRRIAKNGCDHCSDMAFSPASAQTLLPLF